MHPSVLVDLSRRLHARAGQGALDPDSIVGEVPADDYLSERRFAEEQRGLFDALPRILAVEDELRDPGSCVAVDLPGVSALLVRGQDGVVRGLRNACRHRGTRLVDAAACQVKAFVCPYHGWTYDLTGALVHVPHADAFDGRCRERDELTPFPIAVRHGLVWATPRADALPGFLAPIDDELAALGGDTWSLYRRSEREVRGNWKLIIDAFLDAYHIRQLHRRTVYPYFVDAVAGTERAGCHIRAVTARRRLLEADLAELGGEGLRELVTPSYLVFPATILILHPDYVSVLACTPLSPARTRFVHWMLIPEPPRTAADADHWSRSFALIDDGVFASEDLRIVEAMQLGLESGANRTLLFGRHEHAALWFHDSIAAALLRGDR